MKHLSNKGLINVGTIIYLIGLSCAFICFFMMFAGADFVFDREEGLIPCGISYVTGNFINFVLYMVFRTKNAQKLEEIEDEYVSQVEAGMPLINGITGDPFSMKGYKMRFVKNTKKYSKDENGNQTSEERWNSIATLHVVAGNTIFLRPLYIMFLFSVSSHYKLRAIQKFENKSTQNNLNQ